MLGKTYKNVLKDFQTQGKAVEDDRIHPEALGESSSRFFLTSQTLDEAAED